MTPLQWLFAVTAVVVATVETFAVVGILREHDTTTVPSPEPRRTQ